MRILAPGELRRVMRAGDGAKLEALLNETGIQGVRRNAILTNFYRQSAPRPNFAGQEDRRRLFEERKTEAERQHDLRRTEHERRKFEARTAPRRSRSASGTMGLAQPNPEIGREERAQRDRDDELKRLALVAAERDVAARQARVDERTGLFDDGYFPEDNRVGTAAGPSATRPGPGPEQHRVAGKPGKKVTDASDGAAARRRLADSIIRRGAKTQSENWWMRRDLEDWDARFLGG